MFIIRVAISFWLLAFPDFQTISKFFYLTYTLEKKTIAGSGLKFVKVTKSLIVFHIELNILEAG